MIVYIIEINKSKFASNLFHEFHYSEPGLYTKIYVYFIPVGYVCVRLAYTYVTWWHPRPSTSGGCRLICSDWGDNFSFGLTGRTWASHLTKRWGIGWHIPQFSFTWGRSWSACGWSWASWRRYCYCWLSGGWWWSVNIIMYYWMMVINQISNTLNKIE